MHGFIIVLVFTLAGFALTWLNFSGDGSTNVSTYNIIFGNFKNADFGASQKLFASIILLLLNVVLLNLFISMMGDSYDKVQAQKVITDAQTRLSMSVEAMTYLRILKKDKTKGRGYLIYCGPEVKDSDQDLANNEWNGRITLINKALEGNESRIQEALRANDKTDDKPFTKIEEKIEEKIASLEDRFVSLENKMKEQAEQMKKQAREVKEQMDQMKQELKDSLSEMLQELKPAPKKVVLPEEQKEASLPEEQKEAALPKEQEEVALEEQAKEEGADAK